MLRSGWIPTTLAGAFAGGTLLAYGVPFGDLILFSAYLLLIVTAPGVLIWRALRGGPGLLAADVAAGTALGYALTILVYLPARLVGVPQAAVAVPLLALVAFAAVPSLRRHWRGSGERAPVWWSWLLAAAAVVVTTWSALTFFRGHGLVWPGNSTPYPDAPFQLAIAGELKHHMPGVIPFVTGETLRYHWFFHAHLAATSWATGIELQTLLFRLAVLPMLITLVVLVAVLGRAIIRAWWAGPAAVAITLFAVAPFGGPPVRDLLETAWLSPTQTFGAAIFAAVALVLVTILRDQPGAGDWVLFGLLTAGVAGAKATYLPMMLAALGLVAAIELVTTRRIRRATLGTLGLTVAFLLVATLVLFRGSTTGLTIDVLGTVRGLGVSTAANLARVLAGWLVAWAGLALLALRWRRLADPALLFCVGMGLAGFGAVLLTTQPGASQLYFLNSARPYLAIAALGGIAVLAERGARTWLRVLAAVAVVAMLAGMATDYKPYVKPVSSAMDSGLRRYPRTVGQIPAGGVPAARWLRDHSSPDDLIATNVHCMKRPDGSCDNRSFWVSGYAERRILIEGWAYAPTWYGLAVKAKPNYHVLPYWQPRLLADNDAAFTSPSAQTVGKLRDEYGVRWLFVDRRVSPAAGLDAVADLRYQSGDAAVYELR